MVVIGGRTYLISELKGKMNLDEVEVCEIELDKAFQCYRANKNRFAPCLALLTRYEICLHQSKKAGSKKIGSNFGYKINQISKIIRKINMK